jgi:hypothetical protein
MSAADVFYAKRAIRGTRNATALLAELNTWN